MKYNKYLGRKHVYGNFDCIRLVKEFYNNELGVSFDIPSYTLSNKWIKEFTLESIDNWITKYGKKIELTEIKNYDLIVFKSGNFATHFAIYLAPNKILHVEDNSYSKIDVLDEYWLTQLYKAYRHDKLV